MISQKQLEEEISQRMQDACDNDRIIKAAWLAKEVVDEWIPPDGEDSERWELCGYKHVRSTIQKIVNRSTQKPHDEESQLDLDLVLDGWKLVRRRYLVNRDGEQCIIPTLQTEEHEMRAKEKEIRSIGIGAILHADEILRFCDERWPAATGTA